MDFFQSQETARRKTGLLVFYFIVAVALIIVITYMVIAVAFLGQGEADSRRGEVIAHSLWNTGLFASVSLATLALITGGSLFRMASLAAGGHTVAEMLGGHALAPQTADPDERKILNVVEEMAIASGMPVPPVYLLEKEDAINAFAAGYAPGDAVIGVTRGCIQNLSRDELQGVIAHEFSHILNGDMRLNLRLIGVLYGILLISMTGWIIFRTTAYASSSSSDKDGDRKGGNPLPLVGLALYVLGYVGVFFGNLIKAAVSRQREFLADASAVQFTRNPDGIAGALKKIGALAEGSKLRAPEAQEASHLFFGDGVGHLLGLFATHPPLAERIRRIDPSFDGDFSKVRLATTEQVHVPLAGQVTLRRPVRPARAAFRLNPMDVVGRVGTVDPQQLAYAAAVLTALPRPLKEAAYDPFGARAIVYALLADHDDDSVRSSQLARLHPYAEPELCREVERILPLVHRLSHESRLPLISMVVPALRRLSLDQFNAFVAGIRELVQADNQVSLYEYALQRMLLRHVAPQFGIARPAPVRYTTTGPLTDPARHVLGMLAHVGSANPAEAAQAFGSAIETLRFPGVDASLPEPNLDLNALDRALNELDAAAPPLKKQILAACAACIGTDGRITVDEGALLRAIADSLGCPIPPLQAIAGAEAVAADPLP
jgi:Zn-dependent protease with chaperone function